MDGRWLPTSKNSFRDVQVILHPTASLKEVREGFETGSDDSRDLTPFLTSGSQSQFECTVTFAFRRELFGDHQPRPNQILEVRLWQKGRFQILWLGIVDAITSVTMSRGERSMQLIARTRDSHDIWRQTKRVTPLFPQLTDLVYIARRVAEQTGMTQDEILLPMSAFTTRHTNTQMADMTAWDMVSNVFQALGWTPFIDSLGRLRAANRELQGRQPDVYIEDDRVLKIGAQRQRSPVSRIRVKWLDPVLKKNVQTGRKLTEVTITMGWFLPFWKQKVYFSEDQTQRAQDTVMQVMRDGSGHPHGVNSLEQFGIKWHFCDESYEQKGENYGEVFFNNGLVFTTAVLDIVGAWAASHWLHDYVWVVGLGASGGQTVPGPKSYAQAAAQAVWMMLMLSIGTGQYEIYGKPYDYIHPRNISDAFDISAPKWADNPVIIENDFMMNEGHAKAVAVRELIFQARAANKWSVTIVDDPRIEMGDVVEFHDGTRMYIEDVSRQIGKGSEATLELKGFIIGAGVLSATSKLVISGQTGDSETPPDSGGTGGPDDGSEVDDGSPGSKSNPIIVGPTGGAELDAAIQASWTGVRGGTIPAGDLAYWHGQADHKSNGFTDRKWHWGWNRYWEERMKPGDTGSANPAYASEPAVYQP